MGQGEAFTVNEAAVVLDHSERRAAAALEVPTAGLLAVWGGALVVGHLAIWWGVRGQDPYTGPEGWSLAVLGVLLGLALVATVATVARAAHGVSGVSAVAGRSYSLSWAFAFAAFGALVSGLDRLDPTPEVVSLVVSVVPLVLVATIYAAAAPLWGRSAPAGLTTGGLLAATAATATWFDASRMPLVIAVGAGIAFALGALVTLRCR